MAASLQIPPQSHGYASRLFAESAAGLQTTRAALRRKSVDPQCLRLSWCPYCLLSCPR